MLVLVDMAAFDHFGVAQFTGAKQMQHPVFQLLIVGDLGDVSMIAFKKDPHYQMDKFVSQKVDLLDSLIGQVIFVNAVIDPGHKFHSFQD